MQELYDLYPLITPISIIAFSWYMSKRGQKKVEAANQRMKMFEEDLKRNPHQDIEALVEKYQLVSVTARFSTSESLGIIHASFENPGPKGALKTKVNSKSELEEYLSDGNQWLKITFQD